MRKLAVVVMWLALLPTRSVWAEDTPAEKPPPEKPVSLKDRVSYAYGVNLVHVARRNGITFNEEYLIAGMRDALEAEALLLSEDEIRTALQEQAKASEAARASLRQAQGYKNKTEGEAFLAANTKREGVVTLPSGLQYEILTEGTGAVPKATDRVRVHYKGKLLGGPEFDTSYGGAPRTFSVGGVIAGWQEALQIMPVGSHWKVWVPPALGYGEQGKGDIGPHATLVFEIELLGIESSGG